MQQVAALPFRKSDDGGMEVLMLTSRQTQRFIIPKGWPLADKKAWKAAQQEAKEEAGLIGKVKHKPLGRYRYWKRFGDHFGLVEVDVYPLKVREQLHDWPERSERVYKWMPANDAALLVDEPQLVSLLREFARNQMKSR